MYNDSRNGLMANFPHRHERQAVFLDFIDPVETSTSVWTVNKDSGVTGIGTAQVHGGALTLDTTHSTPADNYRVEISYINEFVRFNVLGGQYLFWTCFKVSDATQTDIVIGLGNTDAAFTGDSDYMTDGLFFEKNDGDALLDFCTAFNAGSAAAYVRKASLATLVADTWIEVGFTVAMDEVTLGKGEIYLWIDGERQDPISSSVITHDEELTFLIGIQNGEAANKLLTVDWIGCAFPTRAA